MIRRKLLYSHEKILNTPQIILNKFRFRHFRHIYTFRQLQIYTIRRSVVRTL